MGRKKQKISKVIEPQTELDRLLSDKMNQGFILRKTLSPTELDSAEVAHQIIINGLDSASPDALAFVTILNAVIAHKRLFFILTRDNYRHILKNDRNLRVKCSRRKREAVLKIEYGFFKAMLFKTGYFKDAGIIKSKLNNDLRIIETSYTPLVEYFEKLNIKPTDQLKEIEDFYDKSRSEEKRRVEQKIRNEELNMKRKMASEKANNDIASNGASDAIRKPSNGNDSQ